MNHYTATLEKTTGLPMSCASSWNTRAKKAFHRADTSDYRHAQRPASRRGCQHGHAHVDTNLGPIFRALNVAETLASRG